MTLEIRDDGNGFQPPPNLRQNAPLGKLGLIGMSERADLLGGKFSVKSDDKRGGTTILASVRG